MIRKRGRRVSALSVAKIRSTADTARAVFAELGAESSGKIDVVDILDIYLPQLFKYFTLQIFEDGQLEHSGQTFPDRDEIRLKESVYQGAISDNGMDRFTIAHELGHLILHKNASSYSRQNTELEHKIFEDSEWQADCFAAEFLMPYEEVIQCKSASEIAHKFGVSNQAAEVRFNKINKGGKR